MRLVFLLHVLATLTMFGAIWIVQIVHYPLFSLVGAESWPSYSGAHQFRITFVVGPAMALELATAVALLVARPAAFPLWAVVAGALLVGVIWASTAFVQVPLHNALSGAFDADAHARLVATNWVRTLAWTARAGLVLWLASRAMPALGA